MVFLSIVLLTMQRVGHKTHMQLTSTNIYIMPK